MNVFSSFSPSASNGVIHVIDEVLLPSQVTLSILDLALGAPQLRTLASLLSLAGIASVFGDANASFTVFAPTDAAFAKLPQSLIDTLTNPANVQTLQEVLQFHGMSYFFRSIIPLMKMSFRCSCQ